MKATSAIAGAPEPTGVTNAGDPPPGTRVCSKRGAATKSAEAPPRAAANTEARAVDSLTPPPTRNQVDGRLKPPVNLGLIGLGRIGTMHAGFYQQTPGLNLLAATSPADAAAQHAEQLSIPHFTTDNDAIWNDPNIAAVSICAPSTEHAALVRAAIANHKHVFCEKPLAFDPDVLREVKRAAEEEGVKVMVGFNRRFDPDFMEVQRAIQSGELGELHSLVITNLDPKSQSFDFLRTSGGLFFDFSIHDFDMVRFLTGAEVTKVLAVGAAKTEPRLSEIGDIDTAFIILTLDNGVQAFIHNRRESNYGYDQRIEAHCAKGARFAENVPRGHTVACGPGGITRETPRANFIERYQEAYRNEARVFSECLTTDTQPPVGVDDALKAVLIAHAAQQSLETGEFVEVPRC